ncbi:MAG TPA: HAMP domain-containing sensor histidine kinase [Sphingomonas sp.]|jgi:signal transduction histidine kinase
MRLIRAVKEVVKRYWPSLTVRTILFGTLLFVAALPGVAAVALRVYENTLVQQTEAELIAQGAVLAAAYRESWGGRPRSPGPLRPEPPTIDLRADPVLPAMPDGKAAGRADAHAAEVGRRLSPLIAEAAAVTLAAVRLLDERGVVVSGRDDLGLSYAHLPEVARARAGGPETLLRARIENPYGLRSPLEWLSRAATIRVHHVRPVLADGRLVGLVMLSRSPRGLFLGIYQDRGKIALGVLVILLTLVVLAGVLSRGIAKPIRLLSAATEDVARGGGPLPETPATAAVEIRELYRNFALMAERVELRQRYLRDFAAAVSHEFKTPLAGIRGALELLEEHGEDMDRATRRRFMANAAGDADRLARLVQRLLDLARADMTSGAGVGMESPACDPAEVAYALAERWSGPPEVAVRSSGRWTARATADVLTTVLETLLDNSRRAGATRATLAIEAGRILVADDGSGIDPADRERVFEPFFTATRASGGTGLGLPIARSLLAAFGGRLVLEPSERGATFAIELKSW